MRKFKWSLGLEDNKVSRNEPLKHKQKLNVLLSVFLKLSSTGC